MKFLKAKIPGGGWTAAFEVSGYTFQVSLFRFKDMNWKEFQDTSEKTVEYMKREAEKTDGPL